MRAGRPAAPGTIFQYYTSPIQTITDPALRRISILFQYYTSPIQTKPEPEEDEDIIYFNTTLVRFKLVRIVLERGRVAEISILH